MLDECRGSPDRFGVQGRLRWSPGVGGRRDGHTSSENVLHRKKTKKWWMLKGEDQLEKGVIGGKASKAGLRRFGRVQVSQESQWRPWSWKQKKKKQQKKKQQKKKAWTEFRVEGFWTVLQFTKCVSKTVFSQQADWFSSSSSSSPPSLLSVGLSQASLIGWGSRPIRWRLLILCSPSAPGLSAGLDQT